MTLQGRLYDLLKDGKLDLPLPGQGQTPLRHRQLAAFGRDDLARARLVEAHTDAVAILAEAGRKPHPEAVYGVWAAENPQHPLTLHRTQSGCVLTGLKSFCTGAGLLDRALVTTGPDQLLVDVDLRAQAGSIAFDFTGWIATAFRETQTATACFTATPIKDSEIIEGPRWYLERPGFWHGACGPASCWAGGALALVDNAIQQPRHDPHTLAHLGAMTSAAWALQTYLEAAGREIDNHPSDRATAMRRALTLRHLVESACTDILQRFARTYGPRPLAFDADTAKRYQELELYIRQCHGERDLEVIGRQFKPVACPP